MLANIYIYIYIYMAKLTGEQCLVNFILNFPSIDALLCYMILVPGLLKHFYKYQCI